MLFNLDSEIDRQKAVKALEIHLEQRVIIELKKKQNRSGAQNRYLYLILGWFALELGYTLHETKQLYKIVNSEIYNKYMEAPELGEVNYYRSSADLDTKEMTESIEKFRNYSANIAGVYLPQPDEQRFLNEIEVKMSQNQEYL